MLYKHHKISRAFLNAQLLGCLTISLQWLQAKFKDLGSGCEEIIKKPKQLLPPNYFPKNLPFSFQTSILYNHTSLFFFKTIQICMTFISIPSSAQVGRLQ